MARFIGGGPLNGRSLTVPEYAMEWFVPAAKGGPMRFTTDPLPVTGPELIEHRYDRIDAGRFVYAGIEGGPRMTTVAHYDRHRQSHARGFSSLKAAIAWLAQREELGELAAIRVEDGRRVIEGDELREALWRTPVWSRHFLGAS